MRNFKLSALFILMVFSLFSTGCDVQQIMDVVTNVAQGVSQAAPAIQDAVNTISQVIPNNGNNNNNTAAAPAEQTGGNGANVVIGNPGDQEEVGAGGATAPAPAGNTTASAMQRRISSSIRNLLGSTRFRGPEVDGGNLACAQVVSTALRDAGVLSRVSLNCDAVVSDLRRVGWQRVNVPPYQDGDVVTWTTSRSPGRHIGIIVQQGSSFVAISNSSSQRTPRVHSINYMPITQVLRKV